MGIGEFGAIEGSKASLSLSLSPGLVRSGSDSQGCRCLLPLLCVALVSYFKQDSEILMKYSRDLVFY